MHASNGRRAVTISALLFLFHVGCTLEVYDQAGSSESCGDAHIDAGEACDDGHNNGTLGDPCSATCQTATAITITGWADPKYLITGTQVTTAAGVVLKMTFEDRTPGTNVSLCAGLSDDFTQGTCFTQLSGSGGPGFKFLTIIDANELSGKELYAIRQIGTAPAEFVLIIE